MTGTSVFDVREGTLSSGLALHGAKGRGLPNNLSCC